MKVDIHRWLFICLFVLFTTTGAALSESGTMESTTVPDMFSQHYENQVGFTYRICDLLGTEICSHSTVNLGMPIAIVERDNYVVYLTEMYCRQDLIVANVEFALKIDNGIIRPYETMFEYDMFHTPLSFYKCPVYFCHLQVDGTEKATGGSVFGIGMSADSKRMNRIETWRNSHVFLDEGQSEYQMVRFYIEIAMFVDGQITSEVIEFSMAFPTMTLIQSESSINE